MPRRPVLAALLAGALVLAGWLALLLPDLTRSRGAVASVAAPPALNQVTQYTLPGHAQACMVNVTLVPEGGLAVFTLSPANVKARGKSPVALVLSAPGYSATARVPPGYASATLTIPIRPPRRPEIGTACFVNQGRSPVLLAGSVESRTLSRSATVVAGAPVVGDIALEFVDSRPASLIGRLGEVFEHASNLTDRLAPVWLVWTLAVLVALALPVALVLALYLALREDEMTAAG